MIGRLQGRILEHADDGSCVLDVSGVGYEVFVPIRNLSQLAEGTPATLHVHTHVREDALMLYGFVTPEDRSAFRLLMGVSGVGPKLALTVLSDLSAAELGTAIARGEKQRLEAISGVGKKTAARLLLELKDKLPAGTIQAAPVARSEPAPLGDVASQVCDALTRLGFTRAQAEAALSKLDPQTLTLPLEQLLRRALASLG
ncbi:MAG TPA: Holliday junction branch migration protein RuvA [Polyangiales bacterium]|nr:Holliday junction branch migration protein RuvA [Polyangiales bacterium]